MPPTTKVVHAIYWHPPARIHSHPGLRWACHCLRYLRAYFLYPTTTRGAAHLFDTTPQGNRISNRLTRHSCGNRSPEAEKQANLQRIYYFGHWIPARAGMTDAFQSKCDCPVPHPGQSRLNWARSDTGPNPAPPPLSTVKTHVREACVRLLGTKSG